MQGNDLDFITTIPFVGGLNPIDVASLLLRITIGLFLVFHGLRKSKNSFQGTIGWFNSLGFPFNIAGGRLSAYAAGLVEIVGGFLLFIGLATQFVAGAVVGQMIIASYVAIFKEKSAFISQTGQPGIYGYELDFHYVLGAIALVFLGGGAFSVDALLNGII